MSRIHLLDNSTINKIAAGEVVERPSSVVKELLENSIDAGAGAVTVEIRDGGISLIRITDNGSGIPKADVETAFLRHATSKIEKIGDLENVLSLGFRGEALATVAAVSQTEMITKTKDETAGTRIEIHGGKIIEKSDVASNNGTTISVKNIFYNVPARRKFLKKPSVESGYVSDIVNKIALGHPEVSVKYINNSNVMLHTSGNNDLRTAFFHIYGKEMLSQMLDIDVSENGMRLYGITGKPQLSRGTRSYENLFINGRFIKNDTVSQAIEDAYKTRLMIGKFPVYALNFYLPPDYIDVNVHPAKLEVRFRDKEAVYDFIYTAVLDLFKDKVLIPEGDWNSTNSNNVKSLIESDSFREEVLPKNALSDRNSENTLGLCHETKERPKYISHVENKSIEELQELYKAAQLSDTVKNLHKMQENDRPYIKQREVHQEILHGEEIEEQTEKPFFCNFKIIGQIFLTYWIVEQNSSIFLIDQHAAHERVLYERFMKSFRENDVVSQRLIEPHMLNVSEREREIIDENMDILQRSGFEIERITDKEYVLRGLPFIFKNPESTGFFNEILDILGEKQINSVMDTKILAVATMACKAAVKGNDRLSIQEAASLINELLKLENPFSCPHGRPTIIELTRYELEKKFKRIQ
ncbi:DNA mismatch repair endonuclease MutL [Lachnospiraceae bacterium NSJ-143]|nr:DNA mismatch repair endonuclease MutL [Lachnospiraceae bacterium NSJ-143]